MLYRVVDVEQQGVDATRFAAVGPVEAARPVPWTAISSCHKS